MGVSVVDYLGFGSIPAASLKVTTAEGSMNSGIGEHNANNKLHGKGIFINYQSGLIRLGLFDNGKFAVGNYIIIKYANEFKVGVLSLDENGHERETGTWFKPNGTTKQY